MSNFKNALYAGTLNASTVLSKGDTACTPGVYTLVGEYIVKADEYVGLGRGAYAAQDDAVGRIFAQLKDTNAALLGAGNKLRVMLVSSQDIPIGAKPVYIDVDLSQLSLGATDPTLRYVLPFDGVLLSKDKKIQFFIYNGSAASFTVDVSESVAMIDVTRALV